MAPAPAAPAPLPLRVASAGPIVPLAVAPPPPAPMSAARPVHVASAGVVPVAAPAIPVPAGVAYVPAVAPPEYTLDSGDRLRVVVFGQEGLTNAYLVDAGGLIDVPLIGQVMARGATTIELANRIAVKLRNGFIREPHVAVEVVAYRPFFILGEVTAPGQYPYVPRMTAETAVAIAGGFTPRAFRRNLTVDRPVAGRIVRMSVPPSFPLNPGDTVNVQERWF
jgi:polysaccharide biosynthesis/export protein